MATKKQTVEKEEVIHKTQEEIKQEILDYTEKKIDIEVNAAISRAEKKLIKHKNSVIVKRDTLIVLLLCLSVYLGYLLYKTDYFDKYFIDKSDNKIVNKEPEQSIQKDDETPTEEEQLDELKTKYSKLLDTVLISSDYYKEIYSGTLSEPAKLNIVINNLKETDLTVEDETSIIDENTITTKYGELFDIANYTPVSFTFNNVSFKYIKSQAIYLATSEVTKTESNLVRYITNVTEEDDKVIIETVEGLVNQKRLYNILTNKYVSSFTDESNLESNITKLNTLKYTFINKNTNYLLESIEENN